MPISALRRRHLLAGLAVMGLMPARRLLAAGKPSVDATFVFATDMHACLIDADHLAPDCEAEGKTDANLLRHVQALNGLHAQSWPETIDGKPSGLASAGRKIGHPLGMVCGGDMTDDGGGQLKVPGEGWQLKQFANRYQQGSGPDRLHMPVYAGLGNHDLDQDGAPPHVDWYRRELRDYVEMNHRTGVFFKPPVPVANYDVLSDSYSWDWGGLHMVHLQRFGGDTTKGAVSGLPWLASDLKAAASDGRPVIVIQHYGWDKFSLERWDPKAETFDDQGSGPAHWWSDADRAALLAALKGYNVIGLFHGHEHDAAMIYKVDGLDVFKPTAAFKGGFALVRVTDAAMDVVLGSAGDAEDGSDVTFLKGFSKTI